MFVLKHPFVINYSLTYLKSFVILEKMHLDLCFLLDKTVVLIFGPEIRLPLFTSLIQDDVIAPQHHHQNSPFPERDVTSSFYNIALLSKLFLFKILFYLLNYAYFVIVDDNHMTPFPKS